MNATLNLKLSSRLKVKTWFQNRRMKLKRHQKDSSWVSERYITAGIPNGQTTHAQVAICVYFEMVVLQKIFFFL